MFEPPARASRRRLSGRLKKSYGAARYPEASSARTLLGEGTMLQYLTLLVDLLKGIAWPIVVFVIAYVFRQPLKELFPRITKAGPTGIEMAEAQQVQVSKWSGELLPGVQRTPAIEAQEKTLYARLDDITVEKRTGLLVNALAVAQLSSRFERIYGAIYGSQIAGLRALVNAGGKVTSADALQFFNDMKSKKPEMSNIQYEAWLEFLRLAGLITIDSETISITDMGRDFPLYLTVANLTEAKSF